MHPNITFLAGVVSRSRRRTSSAPLLTSLPLEITPLPKSDPKEKVPQAPHHHAFHQFDPSAPVYRTPEDVESNPRFQELQAALNEKLSALLESPRQ